MSKEKREVTKSEFVLHDNPYQPFKLKSAEWLPQEFVNVIKLMKKIFDGHPENRFILLYGNPGTGKTSILKGITRFPELIGPHYIPIYFNAGEFSRVEAKKLLPDVAKHVLEQLIKNGYATSTNLIDKMSHIKELPLDSAVLTIDSSFESDYVLLLIVDEFENLLERLSAKTISDCIQKLRDIEKNWNNYGLILTGSKYQLHYAKNDVIDKFLETAFKIDLETALDKESIKRLIVEPVKDHLTYDTHAINKIIWYSGKNLFFQQLICYFIVHYLNETDSKRCTIEDVENAIQRILIDRSKEFNQTWDEKISIEYKLIASALADQSITKKESNIYIFERNKLLDAVLGEKTSEIIERLQYLGYINKMLGVHFDEFPFKIPLYGYWIQKEHPFLKTVVENIETLADKIDITTLIEEINKALVDKLILFDKEAIWQTAEKWHSLKSSIMQKRKAPARDTFEGFLESLAVLLKLGSKPIWEPKENFFKLNIKSLNIGILEEASCFIQGGPEITESDIINIESRAAESAEKTNTQLTLFFFFQKSERVEELVKKTYLNLIALDEKDLLVILFSRNPAETLRKTTLNRLSLQSISPYKTEGPARATFYGRSDITKRIIVSHNTSFSIVGARKIGKSSLLHKIKDNPPPNSVYIFLSLELEFHDVKNVRNYKKFLDSLREEIKIKFKKKVSFRKFPFGMDIGKLPKVIKALPRRGKKIIFIFDEIDSLLEFDKAQDYKLMHIFRAMSEKNYCQFIFAGFMELYHIKHDYENPMYNFCQEEILNPLEKEAALDLVTKPMGKIGVQYKNPEDRELILEYTARHPNLIQFFCKKLVEKVDKHPRIEDRRTIFEHDISEVFDTEYQDYIMDDVYMFFSKLSDNNRLILILLIEDEKKYFSLDEIHGLLLDCGIRISLNHVHQNLKELVVRFILIEEEAKYRFAIPVFPLILGKRIDKYFKEKTINEIKKEIKPNA